MGFETQNGLTSAGWQIAEVLTPKMGLQELRAGSPHGGSETQDGLTRAACCLGCGYYEP